MKLWLRMFLAGFAAVQVGEGCSCVSDGGPCGPAKTSIVFVGRVISESTGEFFTTYEFEVAESFRGGKSGRVEVITASQGAACGASFVPGFEYLVYAGEFDGRLHTGLCNGNKLLRDASRDLQYIQHFRERFASMLPMAGYVDGQISNRQADLNGWSEPTWPVAGITVQAQGARGLVATSVTGLDGRYEFFDLPADKYQVSVPGPGRYKPTGTVNVDVQPNSCASVYFLRANRAVLRGWVIESDGQPDSSSELVLLPIGEHPESPRRGETNELQVDPGEDGAFRFDVPPGKYRLQATPMGEDVVLEYPTVLILDEGRESSITFRLPARPTQSVDGLVVDSRNRPVEGATVRISGNGPRGSGFFGNVVTGDRGEFGFEVIPRDYELWVESKTCSKVASTRVQVSKGQTKPVKLQMPAATDGPCPAPR